MEQNPYEENLKDVLTKYGRDVTVDSKNGKIDPVIGRDEEIRSITRILSRKTKNNPVLVGAPGVGKSQAVRQIADNISRKTKKKVNVTDVRLLLFNPIDLRGIPTANEDKTAEAEQNYEDKIYDAYSILLDIFNEAKEEIINIYNEIVEFQKK